MRGKLNYTKYFNTAKWLYNNYPIIQNDIYPHLLKIMPWLCGRGYIDVIEWCIDQVINYPSIHLFSDEIRQCFEHACLSEIGDVRGVEIFFKYTLIKNMIDEQVSYQLFRQIYRFGSPSVAQFVLNQYPYIRDLIEPNKLYREIVASSNIKMIAWALTTFPVIRQHYYMFETEFWNLCRKNEARLVQYIYNYDKNNPPSIDFTSSHNREELRKIIRFGYANNLNLIMWLIENIIADITDTEDKNTYIKNIITTPIFRQICHRGNLSAVIWAYDLNKDNINIKNGYLITTLLYENHFIVVDWIISKWKEDLEDQSKIIDILSDSLHSLIYMQIIGIPMYLIWGINYIELSNDINKTKKRQIIDNIFVEACENSSESTIIPRYFVNTYPNIYVIELDETFDIIKSWSIHIYVSNNIKQITDVDECPICQDTISDIVTCCNHMFCNTCINQYSKYICPLCRKNPVEYSKIENKSTA
tara:strand:+ start:1031 stop:2449 length:1419 start_codon:yes stop_codon:yes gene_type:complete